MSVLIKGGRIVTASDEYVADILVEEGRVQLIGRSLDHAAERVVDAAGKYVLPGAIDPHTHTQTLHAGAVQVDDFTSVTAAAAFGGTTTIIDFALQYPGSTFSETLEDWHGKLDGKAVVDVGFHLAVTDLVGGGSLEELARVPAEGIPSYKVFMPYKGEFMVDDETLFTVMEVAAETGAMVMVHAENGGAIEVLVNRALAAGNTEPRFHALTRPPETEGEATNRAIQLARIAGCHLYVVHVSCAEAIGPIYRARDAGWPVVGETCTQYLFIDGSYLERPNFESAKYVFTPPPRTHADQQHLWHALNADVLSVVASDHAPFNWQGQKTLGEDDFSKIPNGAPGVEDRLPMIHEFGVRGGRISMSRMVELLCTNPARLFGLYPRKGTIAVGSDADIVVFDPDRVHEISVRTHHSKIDYNLYEGTRVTGMPELVLVRGGVVVDGDELVAQPGHGQFVKRARIGEAATPGSVAPNAATLEA